MEEKIAKKPSRIKPWLLATTLFLLIIILICAGIFLWIKNNLEPVSASSESKTFVITEGETINSITRRLHSEGLIRDSFVFQLYLKYSCLRFNLTNFSKLMARQSENCLDDKIQAGSFKLSPSMNVAQMSVALTKGRVDSWLRIIEGLRKEEIANLIAKNYSIKEEDFLSQSREGYLFPDTYLFSVHSTSADIIAKMSANFDSKVTPEIVAGFQKHGLNTAEGIILASIVQREAGRDEDAPDIASVFLNRLNIGMPLGSDVTVQYALGYDSVEKTWWKKDITDQDLTINSPYNTRLFAGLPPGPICSPGLVSIEAVARPSQSDNLYFLYGKDGKTHFAKTLEQHNQNKALYL